MALELGSEVVIIRGILTQKPTPYALSEATHILGDDFGYANTSAQAVVKVDRPLDAAFFAAAKDWTKDEAIAYLESHNHPVEAVCSALHDGRDFMVAINGHAERVDRLRSEIDLLYNRFHRIKHEACRILGVSATDKLDFDMPTGNEKRLAMLLGKLSMLLSQLAHLKALRRAAYRSVEGIMRSWFGWLATRKAKLALDHHAAVVREDLTLVAKEKERPGYFGRTFNKMTNNGAKGQYLRIASAKLRWFGIPEVTVPSYYTSCTDVRHAVVDKRQRKTQDRFVARVDGRVMQADLHAALTIALYALLRPLGRSTETVPLL